jgi:ribosome-binding ATPase YchF (GTP1/OBG family)
VREVDAILLVLRAFESDTVPHPEGAVSPPGDLETLLTELALADLEVVERVADRSAKRAAATKDEAERERSAALRRAGGVLSRGVPLRGEMAADDLPRLGDFQLLLAKPLLLVLNVGEDEAGRPDEVVAAYRPEFPVEAEVVAVCAKLEEEVEDLPDAEAAELLAAYGVSERGTARIAEAGRRLLGLITFYSIESGECRAWLLRDGATAQDAAGEIHTDMARGFIKADVVPADALAEAGSVTAARDRGMVRSEGKEYRVRDGDVLTFRFRA